MSHHVCQSFWPSTVLSTQVTITRGCPGTTGSTGLLGDLSCLHLHHQQHFSGLPSTAPGLQQRWQQAAPWAHLPLPVSLLAGAHHSMLSPLLQPPPAFQPISRVGHNPFSVCRPSLLWSVDLINMLSVSPCWPLTGLLSSGFPAPQ